MKTLKFLGVNLRTVQSIWKELNESVGITKVQQLGRLTMIILIRKKIFEFSEIHAMIDKDPSKSIRS